MPEIDLLQENLKLIRRSAGWTIEELANKIGVTKQTIINLEGLKSKMTKTTYIAIRAVLSDEMSTHPDECKMLYDILDIFVDNPDKYSEELRDILKSKANVVAPAAMTNDISRKDIGFSSDFNEVTILDKNGGMKKLERASKKTIAKEIFNYIKF